MKLIDALTSNCPVGSIVQELGTPDADYEVTGYWRGYVTIRNLENDTIHCAPYKTLVVVWENTAERQRELDARAEFVELEIERHS